MNNMKVEFEALPENEGFARVAVAAFLTPLNPTLEEIEDVKTAVSEAVTNAVIHGYNEQGGTIEIWNVPVWDFLLWKRLWTAWRWNRPWGRGRV